MLSHRTPCSEGPILDLMLCCCHLGILNRFCTRGSTFSFPAESHKLCSQFCSQGTRVTTHIKESSIGMILSVMVQSGMVLLGTTCQSSIALVPRRAGTCCGHVVPYGSLFLVMGLWKTASKIVINLPIQQWLGSALLDLETQCQEAWHEPVFLEGLSHDGSFGRRTHCSCCEPFCLFQNLVPSSVSSSLSWIFNSPFLLALSCLLKITFLRVLPQEVFWERSCCSLASGPRNHFLTLHSLAWHPSFPEGPFARLLILSHLLKLNDPELLW